MTITYRKDSNGEWAAFGPASEMHTGEVIIGKRNGVASTRYVEAIGATVIIKGDRFTFGTLRPTQRRSVTRYARRGRCEDAPCCGCCD
jgi:hypothetical protein